MSFLGSFFTGKEALEFAGEDTAKYTEFPIPKKGIGLFWSETRHEAKTKRIRK